jgi:hypothetical protein
MRFAVAALLPASRKPSTLERAVAPATARSLGGEFFGFFVAENADRALELLDFERLF